MKSHKSYRGFNQNESNSNFLQNVEKLKLLGYFVVESVFTPNELAKISQKLDKVWDQQVAKYGQDFLNSLGDWGVARGMMKYEQIFMDLIIHPTIIEYVDYIIGETAILNLQNGILLFPSENHNQGRYHRDFAKDFISSKLLSVNALIAVDDFTKKNGATFFIPRSHAYEEMPSESFIKETELQVTAPAGSIIFFDSLIWHKGGENRTSKTRRAINQQYTRPFIKQQLDYPKMLNNLVDLETKLAQKIGLWSVPPKGVESYRVKDPSLRSYRSGQG